MNSYLIESQDSLSLIKERESLVKKNNFSNAEKSTFDLDEVPLENALEALDTFGFLSDKKLIIIRGIENLKYEENKKDLEHLFKYIDNPSPDNLLIIEATKLNNTTKIAKELKKKCQYIEVDINPKRFIKSELKDYLIDQNTIDTLAEYCQNDITKISNECQKLKNYKFTDKKITKDDVEELVVKKLGDSKDLTFAFSRSLAKKDKKLALEKYRELLAYNIEPLSIIGLLASQIRIIYQVKLLEKRNLNDREIASMLGEKSDYRITKTRELTRYYSESDLLKLMQSLADIDLKIKTNDIDGNSLIELFIINL